MQQELAESAKGEGTVDIWLEFVGDLWDKHLPHLREELYGEGLFVYNPNTGCYGFQEEEEEESEASGGELMAALLREAAEEDWEEGRRDEDSFKIQPSSMEDSFAVVGEDAPSGHTYDLNQVSSEEEEEIEVEGVESKEEEESIPMASALPEGCKYCTLNINFSYSSRFPFSAMSLHDCLRLFSFLSSGGEIEN